MSNKSKEAFEEGLAQFQHQQNQMFLKELEYICISLNVCLLFLRIFDFFNDFNPPLYKDAILITISIMCALHTFIRQFPHKVRSIVPGIFFLFGCLNGYYGITQSYERYVYNESF